MRKCRLLIITDEMEIGGSQRQITNLLAGIDLERFEPTLLYMRNRSELVDEVEAIGVRTLQIPKRGPVDPLFLYRLIRFLRRERFDVVHAFAFTAEVWGAAALLLVGGTRLITSIRSQYEWYSRLQWWLKGWATRRSDRVVANSEIAGRYAFRRMGLDHQRLVVIGNGIREPDPDPALPADLSEQRSRHGWMITFVGRLVDHKNIPLLLRAMRLIQDRGVQDIGLWLVGDGPDRADLERLRAELDLDGVYFLGERHDVDAIVAHSEAGVLPSWREGLSNTLLEAMHQGVPVVATAVGGTPDAVDDDRNGLLVPSNDPPALANAIIRLWSDPDLSARLGRQAQRDARERYTIPAMVQQFESVYGEVAEYEWSPNHV